MSSISDSLIAEAKTLAEKCNKLSFSDKVWTIYNTFDYALPGYQAYVERYGKSKKRAIFLGMNPGPWGMSQTGVRL